MQDSSPCKTSTVISLFARRDSARWMLLRRTACDAQSGFRITVPGREWLRALLHPPSAWSDRAPSSARQPPLGHPRRSGPLDLDMFVPGSEGKRPANAAGPVGVWAHAFRSHDRRSERRSASPLMDDLRLSSAPRNSCVLLSRRCLSITRPLHCVCGTGVASTPLFSTPTTKQPTSQPSRQITTKK